MPKILLPGSYKFQRVFFFFFSIVALHDINEGGTPYMGISPGRMRPCTHRPGVRFPKASLANYGR